MKKTLFLVAVIAIALPCIAAADTVWVVSDSAASYPDSFFKSSKAEYAFRPGSKDIVVKVAGKTCTLRSSATGSVPMGCNYTIKVAADGQISGELRAGNDLCTQTSDIPTSCK